jgi:hypothetical protein
LLSTLLEAAQDGVGELAVHLDVAFPGKGVGVGRFGVDRIGEMGGMGIMGVMRVCGAKGAGVAEQAVEDPRGTSNTEHPASKLEPVMKRET